jgi:SAM-dependent methyltransferase
MVHKGNDEEFKVKRNEITGYREFARSSTVLDWDGSIEDLLAYARSRITQRNVTQAFGLLRLSGQERVLDLGAGRCWASYFFSRKGCYTIALDFSTDEIVGLKAGNTLVRKTGATFERVAGDGEKLPFRDQFFDIVFGFQVLHHAYNLDKMVAEASRVLRKGGILIAVGEHRRGAFQSEEKLREKHRAVGFGVNEHFPTYFAYVSAFEKAGFREIDILHTSGWEYFEEKVETLMPWKHGNEFVVRVERRVLQSGVVRKLALILLTFEVTILGKKPL